ncbi:NB-ARC domain-containing protein [Mycena venus]|uniref:NB-ARC domain-containing protein n=1 Tax=Mycena venus TaxID=2733690 RepID=A0A8H6YGX2_9AGAR|nr:NB-ARC domain-containing protein [Mycena venus]
MPQLPLINNQKKALSRLLRFTSVLVSSLSDISDAFHIPYVRSLIGGLSVVLETVQSVSTNRKQFTTILERIHMILCIIVQLCLSTEGKLNTTVFDHILRFAETISKINDLLSTRQKEGLLRRILYNAELLSQIQECIFWLDASLEQFRVTSIGMVGDMLRDIQTDIVGRQTQIIELIQDSAESDTDSSASACQYLCDPTTLFTFLEIKVPWHQLHFPKKYFISCESVLTLQDLLVTIASHLGILVTQDAKRVILRFLADVAPCILILDNFETPWEFSEESRRTMEQFLSLLTEIDDLKLIVTMRGLERPGNVRWTQPFLPPLQPLDDAATRQIFIDIADEPVDENEEAQMMELLALTDNLPLAINLLANTASFEGYTSTLERYRRETTEVLSNGYHKSSNLNKSIMLSLCSRRFQAVPHASILLALMSLLPDGLSDAELVECDKHIPNIMKCKSTLLRTSMAFVGPDRRLRVLAPIREYMQQFHPLDRSVTKPLMIYLGGLLRTWNTSRELASAELIKTITANLANIRSLVLYGICDDAEEMRAIGYGILELDTFLHDIYRDTTDLVDRLPGIIEKTSDLSLAGLTICGRLERHMSTVPECEVAILVNKATRIFRHMEDTEGEAHVYNAAAAYCARKLNIVEKARYNALALSLSSAGDSQRFRALMQGCVLKTESGDHQSGIILAFEGRTIARRMGNLKLETKSVQEEATLCASAGQLSRALSLCQEGAPTHIEAWVHFMRTNYCLAQEAYSCILRVASPKKLDRFYVNSMLNKIHIDSLMGHHTAADMLDRLDAVAETAKRIEFISAIWYSDLVKTIIRQRSGDTNVVAEYRRCLEIFRGDPWVSCICFQHLSDAYLQEKEFDEAFRYAVVYFARSQKTGMYHRLHALRRIADTLVAMGEEEVASQLYTVALETFTTMEVKCGRAECLAGLGMVSSIRGNTRVATQLLTEARKLFDEAGRRSDGADMEKRLIRIPLDWTNDEGLCRRVADALDRIAVSHDVLIPIALSPRIKWAHTLLILTPTLDLPARLHVRLLGQLAFIYSTAPARCCCMCVLARLGAASRLYWLEGEVAHFHRAARD